jgi:DNA-binding HxlR family transcriptional regulator
MQVLESLEKKPQKFNELEKRLGIHPQTLSRDLRDLQTHKLAMKTEDVYHITKFGSHVMVVTKDLAEKAKTS